MADSLVLKGVKDVRNHTGDEMRLVRPKRGGDTHMIKEWWKAKGVNTCYVDCTIFSVDVGGNTAHLVLDTSPGTDVRIDHDGASNFTFSGINELSRAALFNATFELVEHYVFPAISGGKIMTVIPPNAADRPAADPDPVIGTPTISGPLNFQPGTYGFSVATPDATATQLSYNWTVGGGTVASGQGTANITASFATDGTKSLTVTVSATDEGVADSPQVGAFNAECTYPATSIGTVNVTGEEAPTDGTTETYTVDTPNATASGLTYQWSVTGDATINGDSTGTTVDVDVTAGSATVTCTVSSSDGGVTDNGASGELVLTIA